MQVSMEANLLKSCLAQGRAELVVVTGRLPLTQSNVLLCFIDIQTVESTHHHFRQALSKIVQIDLLPIRKTDESHCILPDVKTSQ